MRAGGHREKGAASGVSCAALSTFPVGTQNAVGEFNDSVIAQGAAGKATKIPIDIYFGQQRLQVWKFFIMCGCG